MMSQMMSRLDESSRGLRLTDTVRLRADWAFNRAWTIVSGVPSPFCGGSALVRIPASQPGFNPRTVPCWRIRRRC